MKLPYCVPLIVLASFTAVSHAQSSPPEMNPAAPPLSGAQPAYQSAFDQYRFAPEQKQSPDKVWRAVNDELGGLKGHVDHIKDVPSKTPAKPSASMSHGGHGMHHSKGDKP